MKNKIHNFSIATIMSIHIMRDQKHGIKTYIPSQYEPTRTISPSLHWVATPHSQSLQNTPLLVSHKMFRNMLMLQQKPYLYYNDIFLFCITQACIHICSGSRKSRRIAIYVAYCNTKNILSIIMYYYATHP